MSTNLHELRPEEPPDEDVITLPTSTDDELGEVDEQREVFDTSARDAARTDARRGVVRAFIAPGLDGANGNGTPDEDDTGTGDAANADAADETDLDDRAAGDALDADGTSTPLDGEPLEVAPTEVAPTEVAPTEVVLRLAGSEGLDDGASDAQPTTLVISPPVTRSDDLDGAVRVRPSLWRRAARLGRGERGGELDGPPDPRVDVSVDGPRCVVVAGACGGVGASTIALLLGSALQQARRGRVLVVDGGASLGSMLDRLGVDAPRPSLSTVAEAGRARYADLREILTTTAVGVDVLVPRPHDPRRPGPSVEEVVGPLQHHYTLVVLDAGRRAGAGMCTLLDVADAGVLVTTDATERAVATARAIDWLDVVGRAEFGAAAVVACIGGERDGLARTLLAHRVAAFHRVPTDVHLARGGVLDPEALARPTRRAVDAVAAATVGALHARATA